jgi:ribose transport system substrate-binding protein
MKKVITIILVLLMLLTLFTGCASKDGKDADDGGIKIGFSLSTLGNAFFVGMRAGIVNECEAQGIQLVETNADGDIATQAAQMEDLISQGVQALIVNPVDSDAIVAAEKKAVAAGIPVIYCDRGSTGDGYTAFIATDNIAMGELGANEIVKFLTERYGEPKGNVVEIQGLIGTSAARDRGEGFNNIMKDYPNIKIVAQQAGDFNQETSLNVMQNIIQANDQIDAVYGHNDDCTLGALKAIESAGLLKPVGEDGHIYIIGIDGIYDALTAIKDGKKDATISQTPVIMGASAVGIALQVIAGETVEKNILNPFYVIDASNADDPTNWANSTHEGAEAPADSAAVTPKIGFSLSTLGNAFFVGMRAGIVDKCDELGVELVETNADGDIATQAAQMEDLISQGVTALIVNPVDSDAIVASEKKAVEAGIPVIYCDRGSTGDGYTAFIATDNIAMGELGANEIVKFLTERYGEPKGNVVEIQGLIGTSAARDRGEGFNNIMKDYPNIKIVAQQAGDFNQETSLNVMQNIIQANDQIDAVYGHNDDCTLGALKAIESAGLLKPVGEDGHIYIIGIDGIYDALTAIKDGKKDATISQTPVVMGGSAVELAVKITAGETVEKNILNPFYVIDITNADDPTNWANATH